MKKKAVVSAEKVAAVRAIGARDPLVGNPDVLALHFLGMKHRMLVWLLTRSLRLGRWLMEKKGPGAYWYLQARTKHVDAVLERALEEGAEQVVVLGAGYDTRAYRFRERLRGGRLFEVDGKATQKRKKRRLRKLYGAVPDHVTFVEIDFTRESLEEVLRAAGYAAEKKTFFIWEGVTYYLPGESVQAVLGGVRELAAAGSGLVFDYILEAGLAGDENLYGAKEAMKIWNEIGEPGLFGFEDAEAARVLMGEMGFEVRSDIDSREMERRYDLRGPAGRIGRIVECMRFLDAVVAE